MGRVLEIAPGRYYRWLRKPRSESEKENIKLLHEIKVIHEKSRRTYGSPRVTAALKTKGTACGKNRAARLMGENDIRAIDDC